MEKYINEYNKECYRGVTGEEPFGADLFHMPKYQHETDKNWALHTNLGSITVVDRLTGFSGYVRDTESCFMDPEGQLYLASGMQDVRYSGVKTIQEAISWVKSRANTVTGG